MNERHQDHIPIHRYVSWSSTNGSMSSKNSYTMIFSLPSNSLVGVYFRVLDISDSESEVS